MNEMKTSEDDVSRLSMILNCQARTIPQNESKEG